MTLRSTRRIHAVGRHDTASHRGLTLFIVTTESIKDMTSQTTLHEQRAETFHKRLFGHSVGVVG